MNILAPLACSLLLSALFTYISIKLFRYFNIGQSIRGEGPQEHLKKSGTPTMGGIAVLLSFAIAVLVFLDLDGKYTALVLLTIGFGLIGFLDDLMKVVFKKNEALKPSQKMALQIFISLLFGAYLLFAGHESGVTGLLRAAGFSFGWLYLPLTVLMIISASNATNLTDGLDGLLAGTAILASGAYAVIASRMMNYDADAMCALMAASLAGFLIFNFKPAKIFMGDAGSLAIGAFLAGAAILLHKELLLLLIGGVFVIETLSVIVQVASFKMTGRRIFKMSPLHHHFELSGMKEKNVVFIFWGVGLIFAVLGVMII